MLRAIWSLYRMKIALIDNMNNNFFTITRYFRDLGHDADLYLIPNSSHRHFDPQEDTFQDVSKVSWIKSFPLIYSNKNVFFFDPNKLSIFKQYDKIIACGLSVGFLQKAGIKIQLFIPYGSDLINIPFMAGPPLLNPIKYIPRLISNFIRSNIQARGIKSTTKIISNTNWAVAENAIQSLGKKSINLPRLMIYNLGMSPSKKIGWEFMRDWDFIVFSPSRHLWKTNAEPVPDFKKNGGAKRNDKLIKSFARFVGKKYFEKPLLILFEHGADLEFSKQLISDLGIEKFVIWMPLMPRKNLMEGMAEASLVADQFRVGMSATSAGTTNEAMAVGVPVLANTDGAIFDSNDPYYQSPIIETLEEEDIFKVFEDYAQNPEKYLEIGKKSKEWFNKHLGIDLARKYLTLLEDN
jgi:glycosyltransferase involved in cell wall biosynthesis